MNRLLKYLPELSGEEFHMIQAKTTTLSDEELESFANIYRVRRKDPQTVMIMALVGLFVLPGLQRFYLDQIGMGILYLFTLGLCLIGSIVDLVNYQRLTLEFNERVSADVFRMVKTD